MRVFVTGATGFVGANVVRALLARGDTAVCPVRKANRCVEGLDLTLVTGDLADRMVMAAAMEGCEGVLHVAGTFEPGPGGAERMLALHVDATAALLGAAKDAGISRFVTCSSSVTVGFGGRECPGDEDTPYDADATYGKTGGFRAYHDTKLAAERITADAGGVIVNPDYVLGAWDVKPTSGQLLVSVAKGIVPAYPKGGKCFIDAGDCALGHILALERGVPGRRYLLGNWNASYREFMALCAEAAGRTPPFLPVPSRLISVSGRIGSLLQRIDPHRFAGLDGHVLLAMQQERYRTGRRAQLELGLPMTPLSESVASALGWFRENGYC